jgi:hypothetical protein
MSEAAMRLLEQIRALPVEDQDWLAEQLDDLNDDPEFLAEISRRIDHAALHPELAKPAEDVFAAGRRLIEQSRKSS